MTQHLDTIFGRLPCVLADTHWCRREDGGWTLTVLSIGIRHAPLRYTAQVNRGPHTWMQAHGATPDAACRALRRQVEWRVTEYRARVEDGGRPDYDAKGALWRVFERCLELTEPRPVSVEDAA